jgi:hypothetical protein
MHNRRPVHRVALCVTVVLVGLATAAPAQAATRVKQYSPWTSDGNPQIPRYFHGSGECTLASRVSAQRDAWRCVSGNITLDPCFQSPTDEEVLCATSPFARQGHLLSALLDPDTRGASSVRLPWALEVGRRRCVVSRSRARPRRGRRRARRRPSYSCGRRGPYLFGRPNRRRSTWTIRLARKRSGRPARRVRIRGAWL